MSFPGQMTQRCWHYVNAQNQTVGRLANQIIQILRGKHKPTYRPNGDMGDVVVVVNASKVQFSNPSKKWNTKLYRWHTGYPGGLKQRTAKEMLQRNPIQILQKAILGMSPRTNLRHGYMEQRLFIYEGPYHPHEAQLPGTNPTTTTSTTSTSTSTSTSTTKTTMEEVVTAESSFQKHPRKRTGDFHFGLKHYAGPNTYQEGK